MSGSWKRWVLAATVACAAAPSAQALDIVLNGTFGGNAQAVAAFNRAAAQFENRLSDPITVIIDASFSGTGAGLASFGLVGQTYASARTTLIADAAADSSTRDAVVALLPASINFNTTSNGVVNNPTVFFTRANARAVGIAVGAGSDGTITFSTTPGFFDFDNSNGVSPGTFDFESVAAHEIGHVLGFTSFTGTATPTSLDLFRFAAATIADTNGEFGTFNRDIRDVDTSFSTVDTILRFSATPTDGFDPSHWFNANAGPIGVMDPQIFGTQVNLVNENDFLAFDVIGYNLVPIPEPATLLALLPVAAVVALRFRRKKA